jgi:cytochrome c oxidase subunit 2
LLVIIVLVLLAVALWQLTKIFDLTQVGSVSDSSEIATDDDNNVQGYLMFGFLAFIYIFSIYGLNGVHLFFILQPLLMELKLII